MYKIEQKEKDIFELTYEKLDGEEQKIEFKRTFGLVKEMQSVKKRARFQLYSDLVKEGRKPSDFKIETKKDGKTYVDESMLVELEQDYINDEQMSVMMRLTNKILGISLEELITTMKFENDEEMKKFTEELMLVIATGSKEKPKEQKKRKQ